MFGLGGKTTDRIRSGEIPADSVHPARKQTPVEAPTTAAILRARGQGLGHGAQRDGTRGTGPKD